MVPTHRQSASSVILGGHQRWSSCLAASRWLLHQKLAQLRIQTVMPYDELTRTEAPVLQQFSPGPTRIRKTAVTVLQWIRRKSAVLCRLPFTTHFFIMYFCGAAFLKLWGQLKCQDIVLYCYGVGADCYVGFAGVFNKIKEFYPLTDRPTVFLVLTWCYFCILLSSVCLLYC